MFTALSCAFVAAVVGCLFYGYVMGEQEDKNWPK